MGSIRDEICKLQNLADKVPEIATDCSERPGGPGYGWEVFKPGGGPSIHGKVLNHCACQNWNKQAELSPGGFFGYIQQIGVWR